MRTVVYKMTCEKLRGSARIALVSDLHDRDGSKALSALEKAKPDLTAIVGDLTARLDLPEGAWAESDGILVTHRNAFAFLGGSAKIATTVYTFGNHELCGHKYTKNYGNKCTDENLVAIRESGAVILNDEVVTISGFAVGGMASGLANSEHIPPLGVLDELEKRAEMKILLCHHPEYYEKYIKQRKIDLTLSGHAHGGQIRLFGRGLFAPGQGILPCRAGGFYDGRQVVGRGLSNTVPVPRLFNPTELVLVDINK